MNAISFPIARQLRLIIIAAELLASPVHAQTNAVLAVRGNVEHPLTLTLSDLQTMPRVKMITREKDGTEVTFEGVPLYDVINRAQPKFSDHCCSNAVNTVAIIKAADNYQAVFSLAEFDPKFADRQVLLADRCAGQPLNAAQGPLQIMSPDDKVHARWVRQVKLIEVLPVGDLQGAVTNSLPP